ncbi:hypothetical protein GF366_04940 [Candidatus Peregrinibacteria bacterium]|nr:hypothetical protein [Candidatus Peregrinibacteria bacterium]
MKKTITILAFLMIFISGTAFAANTPGDILRENTQYMIQANPKNMDGKVKEYYEQLIHKMFLEESFNTWEIEDEQKGADAEKVLDYISSHLKDTSITLAYFEGEKNEYGIAYPQTGFIFKMPENSYINNIVTPYLQNNSIITETAGIKIYTPEIINGTFSYLDGYTIFSADENFPTFLIEQYHDECETECIPALNENSSFKETKEKISPDSGLNIYIPDFNIVLKELFDPGMEEPYNETMLSAVLIEGVGVGQTDYGFEINTYLDLDPSKLVEAGLDFSNSGSASLYKYLPKENIIFFQNNTIPSKTLEFLKTMPEYQEFISSFMQESEINLEKILSAFENETASIIQDSGELFPSFTILAKLGNKKNEIETELNKLTDYFWKEITIDADEILNENSIVLHGDKNNTYLTKGTLKLGNSELTQFSITLTQKETKNPYAFKLNNNLLTFKITMGITDENHLLISSNKNIQDHYKEGLENNSSLKSLLSENAQGYSYIDVDELNDYTQYFLSTVQEGISKDIMDVSETKEYLGLIFSPFGKLEGTEKINNEFSEAHTTLELDLEKLFSNIFEHRYPQNSLDPIWDSQKEFEDVEINDWYGDDVYYLTAQGTVDGYNDDTYKPEKNINRVEFTKIVIETLAKKGYLYILWGSMDEFNDVEQYAWYSSYLKTAFENYIISGYLDNTFRPENPITRAEVAQIIANAIDKYNIQIENKIEGITPENIFRDIRGNEWYKEAVKRVYEYNIMKGTTADTFEPEKPINRAESAAVIRNLMEIL